MIKISLLSVLLIYFLSTIVFYYSCKKKNVLLLFTAVAFLILMSCTRNGIGTDFYNYLSNYNYFSNLTLKEYIAEGDFNTIGQFLIARLAGFFNSSKVFFGIFGAIIIVPMSILLYKKKDSKNSAFIFFIYLLTIFTPGLNIMKQIAAISISLFSFKYIFEKKFLKFLMILLLASLFHTSILILFPIYFLWDKKNQHLSKIYAILLLLFSFLFMIFWRPLIRFFADYIPIFQKFVPYTYLFNGSKNISFILNLCLLVILRVLFSKTNRLDKHNQFFITLLILGLIFEFGGFSMIYFKRLSLYFTSIPTIVLTTSVCKFSHDSKARYIFFTIFNLLVFILTYYFLGQADIITSLF